MALGWLAVVLASACFCVAPSSANSIARRAIISDIINCNELILAGWSPKELVNIFIDAMWLPAFPNEETPSNVLTDFSAGRLMQAALALKLADLTLNISDQPYLNSSRGEVNAAFRSKSKCAAMVQEFLTNNSPGIIDFITSG